MLNNTLALDLTTETPPARSMKKRSPVDAAAFANFLNAQTPQMPFSRTFADFGGRNANDSLNSRDDLKAESADKSDNRSTRDNRIDERSRDTGDRTDDAGTHSRKDGDTEAGRNSTHSSDSGQERSGDTAMGVDGRENGIQPGASTEAAVNAQSFSSEGEDLAGQSALSAMAEAGIEIGQTGENGSPSDQPSSEEFQQLISQLVSETNPQPAGMEGESVKLKARSIDSQRHMLQSNFNLADQKIMFETGLAEHFVRLLTDQFEQMKNSSAQHDETSAGAQGTAPAVGIGASGQNPSGSAANLLLQSPAETRTPDTQATENVDRIVRIIRSNIGRRQSQLTVRLDPPELGKMRMDVKLIDNTLHLAVTTETQEARQILMNRMETLRQNLEQNGIHLAKFEVVTKPDDAQANQNWQHQNHQHSNQNGFQFNQQQQEDRQRQDAQPDLSMTNNESENQETTTGTSGHSKAVNLVA